MLDLLSYQTSEKQRSLTCDSLRNSVTTTAHSDWRSGDGSLFAYDGQRKYLNGAERKRALSAMRSLPMDRRLFSEVLAWTGARVSEILALTPRCFDLENGVVSIVTLKRRTFSVRQVPLPPWLMASLARHFSLRHLQQDNRTGSTRLWGFCRMTAWRIIKKVMGLAQIVGQQACPKGLRHAFGIAALQATGNENLVQRWMGHARLSTTAIYLNVSGPEELHFARRFWNAAPEALAA